MVRCWIAKAVSVILIVDNRIDATEPPVQFLEKMGYKVQIVDSDSEAMGFIDMVRPGLILLDMMVPNMIGLQLLRAIKGEAGFADIPVIVYTTQTEPKLSATSLALGAGSFLIKGQASRMELLEQINQF